MRGGGVMICPPSLTSFRLAATCAFGNADSSHRRGNPMRRLRFAWAKMLQMFQFRFRATEMVGQTRYGALHRSSQDFRRRLGAQVDDELAAFHGMFQGL